MRSDYIQPHSLDSRTLFFFFVDAESQQIKNRNQQPYKHDNQNILFGQTTFPNQKSPNSKEPIKTVLKTASLQFRGGSLPNVVQTAKATKRKPTKTQQL